MEGMGCLLIPQALCLSDPGGVLQAALAALGRGNGRRELGSVERAEWATWWDVGLEFAMTLI